jgi:hypothetical protein
MAAEYRDGPNAHPLPNGRSDAAMGSCIRWSADQLMAGQRLQAQVPRCAGNEMGTTSALTGTRPLHARPCAPLPARTRPYPGRGQAGAFRGSRGREFESRRPDQNIAGQRGFGDSPETPFRSSGSQARRLSPAAQSGSCPAALPALGPWAKCPHEDARPVGLEQRSSRRT